jgi:tetratricopeptide (TPR) repeat protein
MNDNSKADMSLERKALDHVEAGIRHECSENWLAAAEEYRQIFELNPAGWVARYSANNNLAYVLVQLGEHEQAAGYCHAAIAIRPERYNAHKNLGLALQGMGYWSEAARSFIEATLLWPLDSRAWQHFEHLLLARPHLVDQDPELGQLVAQVHAALKQDDFLQPPLEPSPMYRPLDVPGEQ